MVNMLSLVLLIILGTAAAWSPNCAPCTCSLANNWDATWKNLRRASCEDLDLTSVPRFPFETQFIRFVGGYISSLTGTEFNNYQRLTHIYLTKNLLTVLPDNLFSKTPNVIEIDLEYNNLVMLQTNLFSKLKYLQRVYLWGNHISVLQNNCFNNVPHLNTISLAYNNLRKINPNFMDDFSGLKYLKIHENPVHCDESICEFMNIVIHRAMYMTQDYMPTCASPSSVQGRSWPSALHILWGMGLHRCPRRALHSTQDQSTNGTTNEEIKKEVKMLLQLREKETAEANKTNNEVKNELKELKDEMRVLIKLNEKLWKERNTTPRSSPHILLSDDEVQDKRGSFTIDAE